LLLKRHDFYLYQNYFTSIGRLSRKQQIFKAKIGEKILVKKPNSLSINLFSDSPTERFYPSIFRAQCLWNEILLSFNLLTFNFSFSNLHFDTFFMHPCTNCAFKKISCLYTIQEVYRITGLIASVQYLPWSFFAT
jgi:hypothetical protein